MPYVLIPWVLATAALLFIIIKNKRTFYYEEDEEFEDEEFFSETEDEETVRVAVFDEKAYWVYNNVFYESDVMREPDFTTARPIDTMSVPPKELRRLLSILDELRDNERE